MEKKPANRRSKGGKGKAAAAFRRFILNTFGRNFLQSGF